MPPRDCTEAPNGAQPVMGAWPGSEAPILKRLFQVAAKRGDTIAIAVDAVGHDLSYERLVRDVRHTASRLSTMVERGETIRLSFAPADWSAFAVAYWASLLAGMVVLILPPDLPEPAIRRRLAMLPSQPTLTLRSGLGGVKDCTELTIHDLLDQRASEPHLPPPPPYDGTAMAEIAFTSGTEGDPKPVVLTHAALFPAALGPAIGRQLTLINCFPPASFAGTHGGMITHLLRGATMVSLSRFDPRLLADTVKRRQAQAVMLTPSMARASFRAYEARPGDFRTLRTMWLSGEALPATTVERLRRYLPGVLIRNVYGVTEAGHTFLTATRADRIAEPSAIGTLVRLSSEAGTAPVAGDPGRVMVRRRDAARDATDTVGDGSDWIDTGDTGYVDAGGALHLLGRHRDVIVVDGRKVGASEVEGELREHPNVIDAAVVSAPDPVTGERVLAAVVTNSTVTDVALRRFLEARLPRTAVPVAFRRVPSLPITASGKVDREQVRALLAARMASTEHGLRQAGRP